MSIRLVRFCTDAAVDMYLCSVSTGNLEKLFTLMISATIEQNRGRARSVFSTSTVTTLPYNRNPLNTYFCCVKFKADGPNKPKYTVLKVDCLAKVDGLDSRLLSQSGRSFESKWTVMDELNRLLSLRLKWTALLT